jgi:hypothetical protein
MSVFASCAIGCVPGVRSSRGLAIHATPTEDAAEDAAREWLALSSSDVIPWPAHSEIFKRLRTSPERASEVLVRALASPLPSTRGRALSGLFQCNARLSDELLTRIASCYEAEQDDYVRFVCITLLSRQLDPRLLSLYMKDLLSEDRLNRRVAAIAIGNYGARARPQLRALALRKLSDDQLESVLLAIAFTRPGRVNDD